MAFEGPLLFPGNGYDGGGSADVAGPEKQRNAYGAGEKARFFHKTRLCGRFEAAGSCSFGDYCNFAHGTGELRSSAKHCYRFLSGEGCPYGEACVFPHVSVHLGVSDDPLPPRRVLAPLDLTFSDDGKRPRVDAAAAAADGNDKGRHSCGREMGPPGPAHRRRSTTIPNRAGGSVDLGLGLPSRSGSISKRRADLLKRKGVKWMGRIYGDWIEGASPSYSN